MRVKPLCTLLEFTMQATFSQYQERLTFVLRFHILYYVMQQTLVSTKYQVVIPREVRKKIKVTPGQRMTIAVVGEQIILSPMKLKKKWEWPDDYLKNLKGLWKNTKDIEKYIEKERNSWE